MSSPERSAPSVEEYLAQSREAEILRFTTCGSVDDGKSTLIGRLLYETRSAFADHLAAAEASTTNQSVLDAGETIDFSLLTDGLQAEREQGITIDVAYRYFQTPKRKFIIADTPGHEQYTRNMATGASTAHLSLILVDARQGVLTQSRRHAFISSLLGIRHSVVCINKMDLVDYDQAVFEQIRKQFSEFAARLDIPDLHFVPVSALRGDNVVHRSSRTPWYEGPSLLTLLESIHIASDRNLIDLRLPVQYVLRPDQDFRGYAGQLASGVVRKGDEVMVLPSRRRSKVASVLTPQGEQDQAFPPMSVTVTLEDELDISRGDLLVHPQNQPEVQHTVDARAVWMSEDPLSVGKTYLAKHLTQTIMQREQDIRRSALTGTEMSPLPDDVGCYKGLGRAFVKEPKSVVMETLENTVKASTAEIEQCKQQREYLQKTLTETETNIKELLQGNEALSRELLQNGYQ